MAFRRPLYWDSSIDNFREMSDNQIKEHQRKAIYNWSFLPDSIASSVAGLSVRTSTPSASSGLTLIRLYEKAMLYILADTSNTAYPNLTDTTTYGTLNFTNRNIDRVYYYARTDPINPLYPESHISGTINSTNQQEYSFYDNAVGGSYDNARPLYLSASGIKVMSETDIQDTFIKPAIEDMVDGSNILDEMRYYIPSTSNTATTWEGKTTEVVSTNSIYHDRWISISNAGKIGTSYTIKNTYWYLHRTKGSFTQPTTDPLMLTNDQSLTSPEDWNLKPHVDWFEKFLLSRFVNTTSTLKDYRLRWHVGLTDDRIPGTVGNYINQQGFTDYGLFGPTMVDNANGIIDQYGNFQKSLTESAKDANLYDANTDTYYSYIYPNGSKQWIRKYRIALGRY